MSLEQSSISADGWGSRGRASDGRYRSRHRRLRKSPRSGRRLPVTAQPQSENTHCFGSMNRERIRGLMPDGNERHSIHLIIKVDHLWIMRAPGRNSQWACVGEAANASALVGHD